MGSRGDPAGDDMFLDDVEGEEDDAEDRYAAGKELVVYLVDAAADMLLPLSPQSFMGAGPVVTAVALVVAWQDDDDERTFLDAVLVAIGEDLKARIISRDTDLVSLCFFNAREKKNLQEGEGVFVLQELELPSAQLIRDTATLPGNPHAGRFEKVVGSGPGVTAASRDNPLYTALWVTQALYRAGPSKHVTKRIMLFTNNDDPFGELDDTVKRDMVRTTVQRAKDAQDLGIQLELLPLSRPGEKFNVNIFYARSRGWLRTTPPASLVTASSRFEDLVSQLKKRVFKKRMVRRLALTVAPGTEIALRSYAMLRPASEGRYTWVESRTHSEVKPDTSLICADTGAILVEPIKRVQLYGGYRLLISHRLLILGSPCHVLFTPAELAEIKKVIKDDLQLLGFKSLELLKDHHNLRPPTFLYPDDLAISGSVCAFVALHQAMLDTQRFAVCCYGKSTMPQLVALVAQEEKLEEGGAIQVQPPGMQMIYLPFADDIRMAEQYHVSQEAPVARASKEQVEKALAMIRRIELKDFSPDQISNPSLQHHFAIIEALALDEDEAREVKDETLPDEKSLERPAVRAAVQAFKDAAYGENHDAEEAEKEYAKGASARKRQATAEAAVEAARDFDWPELAEQGKLQELTAEQLKIFCRANHLPLTGAKAVLIDRILQKLGLGHATSSCVMKESILTKSIDRMQFGTWAEEVSATRNQAAGEFESREVGPATN
eukprot:SM000057S18447  [mRNA]  locus=s57:676613:688225:- [translate_table: standard]